MPDEPKTRLRELLESWDNPGFKSVEFLFEAKAYVRATRPKVESREQHGTVSFNE